LFDVASLRVGATERVVSLNCINRPWIPSWDSIVDSQPSRVAPKNVPAIQRTWQFSGLRWYLTWIPGFWRPNAPA